MQVVRIDWSEYLPAAQGVSLFIPSLSQKEPGGQLVHSGDPARIAYFPFAHKVHALSWLDLTAPLLLMPCRPAGHNSHSELPLSEAYVLGRHSRHSAFLPSGEYLPGSQLWHTSNGRSQYCPFSHGVSRTTQLLAPTPSTIPFAPTVVFPSSH